MEKQESKLGDDAKSDSPPVYGQAWINQTGCIVDCNDRFSFLVDSPKNKLIRNTYVTDLVKFDNPNMLLEAMHDLDDIFGSSYREDKRRIWKALLSKVNSEEEHYLVIEKKKEVTKLNNQTVMEAVLIPSCELLPQRHATMGHKSLQSKIPPVDILTGESKGDEKSQAKAKLDDRLKVLVVDDSPTALKIMGRMIQRMGHEVFMAVDGMEALDKLRTQAFDIVLMDINMPKMGGLEAAFEFRKIEDERNRFYGTKKNNYLKVIAMSGDISNTLFVEVTNAGFDTFIPKPLTEEKFLEVLKMPNPKAGGK
jgi:CheY-like chemotaxis protein